MLTETSGSANAAQEAIAKLEFARLVTFNEPPKSGTIQADIVKKFAGGTDKISTRALHKSEREFVPVFKPILACNTIPNISEDSHAVWRRIRIIDFPVIFSDNPDLDDPFQKIADESLQERMQNWAPSMAGYLVHWLQILRTEGLSEPIAVVRRTSEYRDDNDQFKDFIDEYLVAEPDSSRCLQWKDLKAAFRIWHDAKWPNNRLKANIPSSIRDYFTGKLGKFYDTNRGHQKCVGYFGWRLRSDFVPETY